MISLYIQENLIKKISGLDALVNLHTINLQDNFIGKIEGLDKCVNLDTLYIKNNRIGLNGLSDFIGLLDCPSLTCLDFQNNKCDDVAIMEEVLMKMPKLKVLYM